MMNEHAVIIGQTPFALAIACDFLQNGATVTIFDQMHEGTSIRHIQVHEEQSITSFAITISSSIEIINGATMIIGNFGGSYDESLLTKLAPLIRPGVLFVIFPGYFIAQEIHNHVRNAGARDCILCEITSVPCVCEFIEQNQLKLFKRKKRLKIASLPADKIDEVVERLLPYLPMLYGARNVIETSLENINSILHPLPIILNLPIVAKDPTTFRHYIDGIDSHVSQLMHLMDAERLQVGLAWGLRLDPVIDHLKVFYGSNDAATIEEYIHTPECPYDDIRGYGLDSRYITLDIPHLIVPTIALARLKNIKTPLFDACLHLAKPFLQTSAVSPIFEENIIEQAISS